MSKVNLKALGKELGIDGFEDYRVSNADYFDGTITFSKVVNKDGNDVVTRFTLRDDGQLQQSTYLLETKKLSNGRHVLHRRSIANKSIAATSPAKAKRILSRFGEIVNDRQRQCVNNRLEKVKTCTFQRKYFKTFEICKNNFQKDAKACDGWSNAIRYIAENKDKCKDHKNADCIKGVESILNEKLPQTAIKKAEKECGKEHGLGGSASTSTPDGEHKIRTKISEPCLIQTKEEPKKK